jgi:hypothetical protein
MIRYIAFQKLDTYHDTHRVIRIQRESITNPMPEPRTPTPNSIFYFHTAQASQRMLGAALVYFQTGQYTCHSFVQSNLQ